jgi:fumarate reductase flavoprotein subunit
VSAKAKTVENLDANILILGGGGGGLAAAVAAAECGASGIVVLEKLGHLGGNTALATGLFGCESPVQKEAMIDCRADDCFKIMTKWAHWKRINPMVIRAYLNKSGNTIRWLEEKGLKFDLLTLFPNQTPVWHAPEGRGGRLIKVLKQECDKLGVRVVMRTPARKIVTGPGGEVAGVAAGAGNEEINIKTKCVIVATGGFTGNKEMLKKYCPDYYDGMHVAAVHLSGDGIVMAEEAGAAIAATIPMLKGGPGPDTSWEKMGNLRSVAKEPYVLWVNKKGRRFIDEAAGLMDFESVNAVLQQPDKTVFACIDDGIRQYMEENGFIVGLGRRLSDYTGRKGAPGLADELREKTGENDGNLVKIADSWEEMAQWIGCDPEVLQNTVDEYNSFCDRGHDEIFVKDPVYLRPLRRPPYYAVRCNSGFHDTMGGIETNERMEVLNKQGDVIPGMYAAGVLPDGWESDTYCSVLCGSAFGFTINSGRIAGESAAAYAAGIK